MDLTPFIELRPHIGTQQKLIVHGRQQGYCEPTRGGIVQWLNRRTIGKGALNDDERAWVKRWVKRHYAEQQYGPNAVLGQCTACGKVAEEMIWLPADNGGQRAYCDECLRKAQRGNKQSVIAG